MYSLKTESRGPELAGPGNYATVTNLLVNILLFIPLVAIVKKIFIPLVDCKIAEFLRKF